MVHMKIAGDTGNFDISIIDGPKMNGCLTRYANFEVKTHSVSDVSGVRPAGRERRPLVAWLVDVDVDRVGSVHDIEPHFPFRCFQSFLRTSTNSFVCHHLYIAAIVSGDTD